MLGSHSNQYIPNRDACSTTQVSQGPGLHSSPLPLQTGSAHPVQLPMSKCLPLLTCVLFSLQTPLFSCFLNTFSLVSPRDFNLMFSCQVPRHGTLCPSSLFPRSQPGDHPWCFPFPNIHHAPITKSFLVHCQNTPSEYPLLSLDYATSPTGTTRGLLPSSLSSLQ